MTYPTSIAAALSILAMGMLPRADPPKAQDVDILSDGLALPISREGYDLIVYYEVGGKSYYNSRLSAPTVPAWQTTQSGVTIGFGFDAGHNTRAQIKSALTGVLPDSQVKAMQSVTGLKGKRAYYEGLPKVRHTVRVSWEQAEQVFQRDSLPRYSQQTATAFRIDANRLHPHSNGALVSLVFNRGASMSSASSRSEMRNIRKHLANGHDSRIPSEIRAMKRLWSYSKLKGLHLRRDAEAELFQKGLK